MQLAVTVYYASLKRFCLEFGNMLAAVADEVHHYATPGEKIVDKVIYVPIKFSGGTVHNSCLFTCSSHT